MYGDYFSHISGKPTTSPFNDAPEDELRVARGELFYNCITALTELAILNKHV